ncbi:hypothetical protein QQS21_002794 [Conoideocrella luteorostrata]|uniref:Uncharacterized protein n=1 Tax=Conoideocrella luteorostrata TaxID=1105319 RepID=A0AAJ0CXK2_9HYPO|nr:hypothetical protein QQS21_002794 [Conoideocrella luteorostrata]
MAVARALWRPLVSCIELQIKNNSSILALPPRRAFSLTPPSTAKPKSSNPKTVKRFVPEDVKRFVKADGKLLTTRENRDFLVEHNLEPDNGRMIRLSAGPELSRLGSDFNATFAYSPRHVIHPYDLRYFEPRGHPLGPMKLANYAERKQQQPMWIMITGVGGASAVVRTLTQRRLTRSIYRALEELGYRSRSEGKGKNSHIRGTLWITLHNPVKAASQPPERFGRVVAEALAKSCGR